MARLPVVLLTLAASTAFVLTAATSPLSHDMLTPWVAPAVATVSDQVVPTATDVAGHAIRAATSAGTIVVKSASSTAGRVVQGVHHKLSGEDQRMVVLLPYGLSSLQTSLVEVHGVEPGAQVRIVVMESAMHELSKRGDVLTHATADDAGVARLHVLIWKPVTVQVTTGDLATASIVELTPSAPFGAVIPDSHLPEPKMFLTPAPPAQGPGANPVITSVPDPVWKRMLKATWARYCTPRSHLRLLSVNYIGFDGYRYRGQMIVADAAAHQVAQALTGLYDIQFPIRSMVLPDEVGRAKSGPGADDYASMAADNSSAFNCRFVVGKETSDTLSPHGRGTALDVNPWENPYHSANGAVPNSAWLTHRQGHPGIVTDKVATILTDLGFTWGGTFRPDYDPQHFEIRS